MWVIDSFCISRCNNREFLFADPDHALLLGLLGEARGRFPLRLYDYCLMTNVDAPSRYERYLALLREELARPAVTLAETWLVGRPRFVARMEKRFSLRGPGRRIERSVLGGGLIGSGPKHGGAGSPNLPRKL